jgi:hypothetical protein
MIKNIIIEGIDRLGKDTLIQGILQKFGFHQVLHYQKPMLLDRYFREAISQGARGPEEAKRNALKMYQEANFRAMFQLLKNNKDIICNRAHLGEVVYSKRYRGYDGSYVFDIERSFNYPQGPLEKTMLVVLYTSDFSFISDDGQSFDVTQREAEQHDFLDAFDRSLIPNKLLFDVNDKHGKFVEPGLIVDAVVQHL